MRWFDLQWKFEPTATRERLKSVAQSLEWEDDARWARYQETGQAIPQERVMLWLDALAEGRRA